MFTVTMNWLRKEALNRPSPFWSEGDGLAAEGFRQLERASEEADMALLLNAAADVLRCTVEGEAERGDIAIGGCPAIDAERAQNVAPLPPLDGEGAERSEAGGVARRQMLSQAISGRHRRFGAVAPQSPPCRP